MRKEYLFSSCGAYVRYRSRTGEKKISLLADVLGVREGERSREEVGLESGVTGICLVDWMAGSTS